MSSEGELEETYENSVLKSAVSSSRLKWDGLRLSLFLVSLLCWVFYDGKQFDPTWERDGV
jgi:hypothetical protein